MSYKKILVFSSILVLIACFVYALTGDGVKITSPSNANYTTLSSVLFNVSFLNATDITDPSNATFYINLSGAWIRVGSTSVSNGCQVGASTSSCAVSITNSTITEGVYSINATIYNSTNTISVIHLSNLSSLIYIDPTAPTVIISSPLTGGNYSQNVLLNVSVSDLTVGVGSVFFNITNSSGQQNSTVFASVVGSSYTATINASHFLEGFVNITVYANDTLGNLNKSVKVHQLIFDNTLPSINHTCDDYTVEQNEDMDCDCTGSDSLTGLDTTYGTNGVSFTASPSTTNTGNNKETTCNVRDRAQNTRTSTLRYNVTGGTATTGTSGSGTGSSSGNTGSSGNINNTNSTNSDINITTISGPLNTLEGNQAGGEGNNVKLNIWILFGIIVVFGVVVAGFILIKKKIKSSLPMEKLDFTKKLQ